jgi:hypothetical protein
VALKAWGFIQADIEHATDKAMQQEAKQAWDFVDVEHLNESPCPLDVKDDNALAAEEERYWAYVVYPVRSAP